MARNKYGAIKTTVNGITFDSRGEAARYQVLCLMERAGAISGLCLQQVYTLAPACKINGRMRPPLRYKADFVYVDEKTGDSVIEDFKGQRTEGYRIKRHLMKAIYGIDILETGARSKRSGRGTPDY